MIKFIKPVMGWEKEKEIARVSMFRRIEESMPKTKAELLSEAILLECRTSLTGCDSLFGLIALLVSILLILLDSKEIFGFIILTVAIVVLLKAAVKVSGYIKDITEIKKIHRNWQQMSYEECMVFAEQYKENDWAGPAAQEFLYQADFIITMQNIADSEILEVITGNDNQSLIIVYADKNGTVKEFEYSRGLIGRSTNITEAEIKVNCGILMYTVPYVKEKGE